MGSPRGSRRQRGETSLARSWRSVAEPRERLHPPNPRSVLNLRPHRYHRAQGERGRPAFRATPSCRSTETPAEMICHLCRRPVMQTPSCLPDPVAFFDKQLYPAVTRVDTGTCKGCGIWQGGTHHPGCKHERCPRCRELLLECGCMLGRR